MLRRPLVSAANEEPANTVPFRASRFVSRNPLGRLVTRLVIHVEATPEGMERISLPAAIKNRPLEKTMDWEFDTELEVPTFDQVMPFVERTP